MRNKENIGYIVRGTRAITSLSLKYKILTLCYFITYHRPVFSRVFDFHGVNCMNKSDYSSLHLSRETKNHRNRFLFPTIN